METTNTEIKNDNLTINVKQEPGCHVTLDVKVSPTGVLAAYQKAIKAVSKEVSLPGFRQGKAPEALIKQKFSGHIDQELKTIILNTTLNEALNLVKLYPFQKNSITPSIKSLSKEEGAHIVYEFESTPKIPDINPAEVTLKSVARRVVTDEEVDSSIHDVRVHHATWNPITDRGIEPGDFVDVTIENLDDNHAILCEDARFEVTPKKMGKWMIDAITGLKEGESVEKISEPDELIPSENFKATKCLIKINKVQHAELPALDEEFAKKVGLLTIDELKSRVKNELEKQASTAVEESYHNQIRTFLVNHYHVEIPNSIIKTELSRVMGHLADLKTSKEEKDRLLESETKNIHNQLSLSYMALKFAEAHNIKINNEEFVREYVTESYKYLGDPRHASEEAVEELRNQVYYHLMLKKVFDFIIKQAKFD